MTLRDVDVWLASKASEDAPAALRDALTLATLAQWLAGVGLPDAERAGLALSTRHRVDALALAALDAAAGEDADGRAGVPEWMVAGGSARAACRLIAGGRAAGRADAKRQAAEAQNGEPSDEDADAFAAWRLALGLRAMHALWAPQFDELRRDALPHPLAPLAEAWIDAHRPPAKLDRWPRGTLPRLVTTERLGELATLEAPDVAAIYAPNVPELGEIQAAPQLAYIPGLAPADATPRGIVPAAWLALMDGFSRAHDDPREWQRALRLLIEVVSTPDPRERVGTVRVYLPVGGAAGIIARLWSDGRTREHYPALRRALGLAVSAALPASGGHAYLPAQLDRWQRPDALAFNVTYPRDGGNGATFDRAAFRRYGMHPRLFRVYLAVVWALDSRRLRRRDGDAWRVDLTLDALAALAAYPNIPRTYADRMNARTRTRAALDRLADDGAIGGSDLAGRGSRQRLALWRLRPALPDAECG